MTEARRGSCSPSALWPGSDPPSAHWSRRTTELHRTSAGRTRPLLVRGRRLPEPNAPRDRDRVRSHDGEGEVSGRIELLWLLSLAVFAAGCSADDRALPAERGPSASETAASESVTRDPVSTVDRDDLAAFMKKVELVDRVGAQFELRDIQYTAPTDAVAWFDGRKSGDTVISTTTTTGSTRRISSSGTALRRTFRTFHWDAGLSRSSPEVVPPAGRLHHSSCTQAAKRSLCGSGSRGHPTPTATSSRSTATTSSGPSTHQCAPWPRMTA